MKPLFILLVPFMSIMYNGKRIAAQDHKALERVSILSRDTARKPQVIVSDTTLNPMILLVIRDTASSAEAIGPILGKRYAELYTFIGQKGLVPGSPMAFYYTGRAPYIMETAVGVNKTPDQTIDRIKINKMSGGNAVVAHYTGPYSGITLAYTAIFARIGLDKMQAGVPFEVYLNSPMQVKDSFELRTDVFVVYK